MSTLRKHLTSGFTCIPNETLRDSELSFKATGILAVLLSHSDGWNLSATSLARGKKDGLAAVRSGYLELVAQGYMYRERVQRSGRIETVVHVSDTPQPEWPSHDMSYVSGDFVQVDNQPTENRSPLEEQVIENQTPREDTFLSNEFDVGPKDPEDIDGLTKGAPRRIMDAWVQATGRNPKTVKLNAKRLEKVRARARDGYDEQDMIDAVSGIALSAFHQGDNRDGKKYDEMELALRDGGNVEKFRDLYRAGGEERPGDAVDRVMAMLQEQDEGMAMAGQRALG